MEQASVRPAQFQFQSGAIKSYARTALPAGLTLRFQFQSGAIKSVEVAVSNLNETSFNSSLVRLKAGKTLTATCSTCSVFQFQSGAIKRTEQEAWNNAIEWFQFQSGAIKSPRVVAFCFIE